MKNKVKFKNKILITLMALILAIITLPFGFSGLSLQKAYAYTPTTISVENGDFSSSSGSYPKTATGWSKATGSNTTTNIKAGVISTVLDTFKNEYKQYGLAIENTSGLEYSNNLNVYMINALDNAMRYGIKSSNISLEANSFYKISVDVKTSIPVLVNDVTKNLSSMASIYLNVGEETTSFIGIDTNNGWDTYTFYVQTDKFVAPTLTVELWLGSKLDFQSSGAVWFDNLKVTRYSKDTWASKSDSKNKTFILDDRQSYDASDKVENADFEDLGSTSWVRETNDANNNSKVVTGICSIGSVYDSTTTNIATNPQTNGNPDSEHALFINNTEKAGTIFKSNTFKIEKYTNYLIEVYVKTSSFEKGGARIALVPTNEDLTATEFTEIKTNTVTNSITNNWTCYSIYVQGSPFADEEVYLELGVGSTKEDDLVEGYAFFDDVQISKIDYKKYNNASTSSTVKKAKLHNISTSKNFENAFFNFVDDAFTGTYPLAPSNWTSSNSDNTENSGIISTRVDDFNSKTALYYGNLPWYCVGFTPLQTNLDETTADNNLLMIYNKTANNQSYTSSTFQMEKSKFYKLTVDARTLTSDKAFIKVNVAGNTIVYDKFTNDPDWVTFEYYIATGLSQKDISVELGLGTEDVPATGYAFFDNVIIKEIESDVFVEAKKDSSNNIYDYTNDDFSMFIDNDEELMTPANWSTTGTGIETMIGIDTSEDVNALKIATLKETANITSTSSIKYELDSETFYLVTFEVKTSEFKDLQDSGAKFGFKESTNVFFNKVVNFSEDYAEYKFYINGKNYSTITPYIELNVKDSTSAQFVKVSKISIETITETTFTEMSESLEKDSTITDCLVLGEITEEDSNNDKTSYVGGTFEWYYIPTIITTLALIIAIIGVIHNRHVKKKNKKAKQKKYTNNYDREITLHKAIIDREAEAIKKKKLDELKEKLAEADRELDEIETDYKENLGSSKLGKEHEFKKYAKNRKKVADKKEKLEAEKKYVESDEFMRETTEKVIETYEAEDHKQEVQEAIDSQGEINQTDEVEVEIEKPDKE